MCNRVNNQEKECEGNFALRLESLLQKNGDFYAMGEEIKRVIQALSAGKIVAIETDTIPGFAVDATNPKALQRLFEFKQRSKKMPIAWLIADYRSYRKDFEINKKIEALAEDFWPGGLTLVLKKKTTHANREGQALNDEILKIANRGFLRKNVENVKNTQGLRIPNHRGLLQLLSVFGKPLAASSANISGREPCGSIEEVRSRFSKEISMGELICANLPREFARDGNRYPASVVIDVSSFPWTFVRPKSENKNATAIDSDAGGNGGGKLVSKKVANRKIAARETDDVTCRETDEHPKKHKDEEQYRRNLIASIFPQSWEKLPEVQKKIVLRVLYGFKELFLTNR